MLRWTLLILLLANTLLYGWFYQEQEQRRKVADRVEKKVHGVAELDLLSEVPESVLRLRKPKVVLAPVVEAEPQARADPLYCYRFGVFAEVRGLEAWLGEEGPGQLQLEQVEAAQLPSAYRVYISAPKKEKQRQELVESMRSVGLEAEWLSEGRLKGKLSLGVYQQKASANALELALHQQGYDAAVVEQKRYRYKYYLLLQTDSEVVASTPWVRSLLQKYPDAKSEKKLCQGLASIKGAE